MSEDSSIFKDFLRGDPRGGIAEAPDERFQDERKILASAALRFSDHNREGKIFLGLAGAKVEVDPKEPRLPDGRTNRYAVGGTKIGVGDDRHIVTIAGSRAGKSRAVLVPNLITYPGSMLVIDPKGDLAKLTADRRRRMGQEVHILNPFGAVGVTAGRPSGFNPLALLEDSRNLVADAGLIADALVIPGGAGSDSHWDDSARNIIEGLVLHVATHPAYKQKRHLVQVHDLLWKLLVKTAMPAAPTPGGPPIADQYDLQTEMMENPAADGAVMNAARDFYERNERERDSVLSTTRRHMHFLGYKEIQKTLVASSFDLADLKREPMTIFLSLPAMRMGTCSRWLRLFVNLTLAAMEMVQTKPRYNVLMCLDEFAVLGPMKQIEDAAGQIAGLGCTLWPILQDLGQLKALYRERWETFLGNAGVLQFFGNSELTTLQWISKRLGTTTIVNHTQRDVSYKAATTAGDTGTSAATATCDLMTASEAARYFGRDDELLRQLIIRPTVKPIVLHRAFYDRHEFFRDKYTSPTKKLLK